MRRITRVPDSFRAFDVTVQEAARIHHVGPQLLERLLDGGLPHRRGGDGPRLDRLDLENVGIALRLATPRWTAMRSWRRCLDACPRTGQVRHRLTVSVACPTPGTHHCDLALHPAAVAAGDAGTLRPSVGGFSLDLTATAVDHRFGAPFTELIECVRPLEYHLLPRALVTDLRFVMDTGLADCVSATMLLVHQARSGGIPVRPAVGYLLMAPFPTWHSWVEFGVDGGWLAADPFMLNALVAWEVADPAQWPANRSPNGLLWRCHTERFALVAHAGEPAPAQLVLRRIPPGSP
jgi:hypothetical protein